MLGARSPTTTIIEKDGGGMSAGYFLPISFYSVKPMLKKDASERLVVADFQAG